MRRRWLDRRLTARCSGRRLRAAAEREIVSQTEPAMCVLRVSGEIFDVDVFLASTKLVPYKIFVEGIDPGTAHNWMLRVFESM